MPALMKMPRERSAILQALLVTLLWSSSWVLIKWGLEDLPPVTFAGLRYVLAFSILLVVFLARGGRRELGSLSRRDWGELAVLGLIYYTLAQGAQFIGLSLMPANTLSLMLSLSAVVIALLGLAWLRERLSALQWSGVFLSLAGAFIYFGGFGSLSLAAWGIGALSVLSTSAGAVISRAVNRRQRLSPLLITMLSMGIGSLLLFGWGLATEPFPALGLYQWAIIIWLAAANTAFAFTLWSHTQRTLDAAQSGVIANTMLIQIGLLAWVVLGERLSAAGISGLLVVALGTVLVQVRSREN